MCFVLEMQLGMGSRNLHSQIASEITRLIAEGLIKAGYLLPSTRLLSEHLGVSRNTVLRAYENLAAEGFIEMRPPRGTFVSDSLPADMPTLSTSPAAPTTKGRPTIRSSGEGHSVSSRRGPRFDFQYEQISKDVLPAATWRKLTSEKLRLLPHEMARAEHPAGNWDLRCALAEYLGPSRSIKIAPDQVIVTSGLQQAISIVAALFSGSNRHAVVEQPRYNGFDAALRTYGYEIFPVEADSIGLRTEVLPETGTSLVCVTASRQFPFGGTLTRERREELFAWSQRNDAYILDAEIQNDFRYDGLLPPALMREDKFGRTLLAGSFESSLGRGVRLGYLIVPSTLSERAIRASANLGNASSWLDQSVLASFIKTGEYKHHLLRLRKTMMLRKDTVLSEISARLGKVEILGDNGGTFFNWRLPDRFEGSDEVVRFLRSIGISINSFNNGSVSEKGTIVPDQHHLMVGYGGMKIEDLRQASALMSDQLAKRFGDKRTSDYQRSDWNLTPEIGLGMAP